MSGRFLPGGFLAWPLLACYADKKRTTSNGLWPEVVYYRIGYFPERTIFDGGSGHWFPHGKNLFSRVDLVQEHLASVDGAEEEHVLVQPPLGDGPQQAAVRGEAHVYRAREAAGYQDQAVQAVHQPHPEGV